MSASADAPALVAYDGSDAARAAVREAAGLLSGRLLLVVTVWEPGLAALPMPEEPTLAAEPSTIIAVDRALADHASEIAEDGARLAREAGAVAAEPLPVADELDPAETLAAIADQRDAAVIVLGSRGLTGIKARLHGSTTQKLMHHTSRPLLLVRADA